MAAAARRELTGAQPISTNTGQRGVVAAAAAGQAAGTQSAAASAATAGIRVLGTLLNLGMGYTPTLTPDGTHAVTLSFTGFTSRIAVIDTANGRRVGQPITVNGTPTYMVAPLMSPDGSRAVITTATTNKLAGTTKTQATVVDPVTGRRVGSTFSIVGTTTQGAPQALMNVDGTRAAIVTTDLSNARVAVIDTATGAQVGNTVTLVGPLQQGFSTTLSADKTLATVTTTTQVAEIDLATGAQVTPVPSGHIVTTNSTPDYLTGTVTNQVSVIDRATGNQVGTTYISQGQGWVGGMGGFGASSTVLTPNGDRALITTPGFRSPTGTAGSIAVIDIPTGTQVGSTASLGGAEVSQPSLNGSGTRAVIAATNFMDSSPGTTFVSVIDTTTGAQIGDTLSLAGTSNYPAPPLIVGTRAIVTTTGTDGTWVSIIDTKTGTKTDATRIAVTGLDGAWAMQANADGTRALIYSGTQIALIDTATGAQLGKSVDAGPLSDSSFIAGDSRVLITDQGTTEVATVLDTSNGAQVGTMSIDKTQESDELACHVSADGTRVIITKSPLSTWGKTSVSVMDTLTGAQTATTVPGSIAHDTVISPDGKRAIVSTNLWGITLHVGGLYIGTWAPASRVTILQI